MKTPSTEAGSLRALTDAQIERLAAEFIAEDWEPDRYYRNMDLVAFVRAALSAASPPEPEISMDSLNHFLGRGHQTESAGKTAAPNDSDTERLRRLEDAVLCVIQDIRTQDDGVSYETLEKCFAAVSHAALKEQHP